MKFNEVTALALTASAIAQGAATAQSTYRDAVMASSPAGYWRLNETAGPAVNEVPGGLDGTPQGAISRNEPSAAPSLGGCARFNEGSITVPFHAGLTRGPEWTVELWMRRDPALTNFGFALSSGNDITTGSMKFVMRPAEPDCTLIMANGQFSNARWFPYTADQTLAWHHYAFVYSRSNDWCRMYVDGAIVDQKPIRVPFATNQNPLVMGRHDNGGSAPYWYRGWIDEVAVYQRALDPAEIRSHVCAAEIEDSVCCRADLNQDGSTNGGDLGILLGFWGTGAEIFPAADIDGNGLVDGNDLSLLLASWVHCPG